jgi:hypothetical protein
MEKNQERMIPEDKNWKGHTALLVAYIIFGLNTPISKYVVVTQSKSRAQMEREKKRKHS